MEVKIDKATFNRFNIAMQIKYFNSELKKGFSITDICRDLNISYNTIRDRFLRNNYIYNKFTKQYELKSSYINFEDEALEKVLEKLVTKVFNHNSLNNNHHHNNNNNNNFTCNHSGSIINRSFRIYKDVLDEFVIFCENSNYSQYDILSQFISEGIKKYSNTQKA